MKNRIYILLFLLFLNNLCAYSWHDQTHISVGTAAGFNSDYNLAAPDVAKLKAKNIEAYNHYCNMPESTVITPGLVRNQIEKYNSPDDSVGHIYGAIVAAIRDYKKDVLNGKYAVYNLVYAGHYIGDLSMPLHNTDYNDFNKKNHVINDGTIEKEVASNIDKIKISPMIIKNENDLINLIVQIATESKELGYKLEKENRNMTKDEAYSRISRSASLFKAVLEYVNYK